jgi:hypothetical protein
MGAKNWLDMDEVSCRQIFLCDLKRMSSRGEYKNILSALTTFSGTAISLCKKILLKGSP